MSSKIVFKSSTALKPNLVNWQVFTAWVETEGSLNATIDSKLNPRTGTYYVRIVRQILILQMEREPLAALHEFLLDHGIYSTIRIIKPSKSSFSKKSYFRLEIQRTEDIDKVVENIKDYLLTKKTMRQVEFYLRTRHMSATELRNEFLQTWIESRRDKKRRGRKGHYVY